MRDLLQSLRPLLIPVGEAPPPPEGLSPSAVLLPLYPAGGDYHLLLTKRTGRVEHHRLEMCFPGGAREPGDRDLVATALREAQEELGMTEEVEVLGLLPYATTRTTYAILPVVGVLPARPRLSPNWSEVGQVVEVPLSALLEPAVLREEVHLQGGRLARTVCFGYNNSIIYGATARILLEFTRRLARAVGREVPWMDGTTCSTD